MLQYSVAWQRVRQLQEEDVTVMGKVLSLNRGGLLVDVEHIKGFVPTSQLGYVSRSLPLWLDTSLTAKRIQCSAFSIPTVS